ncbi:MAG: hypothetical protein U1E51_10770, partial [Candidatus Binatia bacterium]|nr:hypothetical protein [Candidatus Binatia bacterium]
MRRWLQAAVLSVLCFSSLAWADGDHGTHAPKGAGPLWVWGLGGVVLLVVAVVLIRQAKRGTLIGDRFRGFSHNARLLLLRSPFSGLSASLLRLLFNLYLLAVGFDLLFVAKFAAINWTCHGLSVIPPGFFPI